MPQVGEYWHSFTNYLILGLIVERLYGKTLDATIKEDLLQPLLGAAPVDTFVRMDMSNTSGPYDRAVGSGAIDRMAHRYSVDANFGLWDATLTDLSLPGGAFVKHHAAMPNWAAGGVVSSVGELGRFWSAIMETQSSPWRDVRDLMVNSIRDNSYDHTGYGIEDMRRYNSFGSQDSILGYRSYNGGNMWYDVATGIVITGRSGNTAMTSNMYNWIPLIRECLVGPPTTTTTTTTTTTATTSTWTTTPPAPMPASGYCGFESPKMDGRYCGMWYDAAVGDSTDWRSIRYGTPTYDTGPSFAASGSYYLYIEPHYAGSTAILKSPPLIFDAPTTLRFKYHMYGSGIGSLTVRFGDQVVFSRFGDHWNQWHTATISLPFNGTSHAGNAEISFVATTVYGNNRGDIAIDELELMPTSDVPAVVFLSNDYYYGVPLVEHMGEVGTICNSSDTTAEFATVICRMLGFGSAYPLNFYTYAAYYGRAYNVSEVYPAKLDGLRCTGTESNIMECPNNGWNTTNCSGVYRVSCGGSRGPVARPTPAPTPPPPAAPAVANGTCSFERGDVWEYGGLRSWYCDMWGNVGSGEDTRDWHRDSWGTPSSGTGPSFAADGYYYLHIEASNGNWGDAAILRSRPLILQGSTTLRFKYHMVGSHIGSLLVMFGGEVLFNRTGSQWPLWHTAVINLPNYNGTEISLVATHGSGFQGDIAIDELELVPTTDATQATPMLAPPPSVYLHQIPYRSHGGILVVVHHGYAGTVCDTATGGASHLQETARVACRMMGYGNDTEPESIWWSGSVPGHPSWAGGVLYEPMLGFYCSGSERSVFDCPNSGLGFTSSCSRNSVAWISCAPPAPAPTPELGAATIVTGDLELAMAFPDDFMANLHAKVGVSRGISEVTQVPDRYISVTMVINRTNSTQAPASAPTSAPTGAPANLVPDCVVGTTQVYQPSPGSGKCYCGTPWSQATTDGYCNPDPYNVGLSNADCVRDADDPNGRCGFYCTCASALTNPGYNNQAVTCCRPGSTMGLRNGVVVLKNSSGSVSPAPTPPPAPTPAMPTAFLSGSFGMNSGVLVFNWQGQNYTVCEFGGGRAELARVACRMMGLSNPYITFSSFYGRPYEPANFGFSCSGTESNVYHCPSTSCVSSKIAWLQCAGTLAPTPAPTPAPMPGHNYNYGYPTPSPYNYGYPTPSPYNYGYPTPSPGYNYYTPSPTPTPASVFLHGGWGYNAGMLVVQHHGEYGTICNSGSGTQEFALVACRMLGFSNSQAPYMYFTSGYSRPYPATLDGLRCSGTESNIMDCQHYGWNTTNCTGNYGTPYLQCYGTPAPTPSPTPAQASGEFICENRGYNRNQCSDIGCCQFDDSDGSCWSGVEDGPCYGNNPTPSSAPAPSPCPWAMGAFASSCPTTSSTRTFAASVCNPGSCKAAHETFVASCMYDYSHGPFVSRYQGLYNQLCSSGHNSTHGYNYTYAVEVESQVPSSCSSAVFNFQQQCPTTSGTDVLGAQLCPPGSCRASFDTFRAFCSQTFAYELAVAMYDTLRDDLCLSGYPTPSPGYYYPTPSPGYYYTPSPTPAPAALAIRLSNEQSGLLEVLYDNVWGTVCDDAFDWRDAEVACRQLGYRNASWSRGPIYGRSSQRIWLDNLYCSGTEQYLSECSHNGVGHHNCEHSEDVNLHCSVPITPPPTVIASYVITIPDSARLSDPAAPCTTSKGDCLAEFTWAGSRYTKCTDSDSVNYWCYTVEGNGTWAACTCNDNCCQDTSVAGLTGDSIKAMIMTAGLHNLTNVVANEVFNAGGRTGQNMRVLSFTEPTVTVVTTTVTATTTTTSATTTTMSTTATMPPTTTTVPQATTTALPATTTPAPVMASVASVVIEIQASQVSKENVAATLQNMKSAMTSVQTSAPSAQSGATTEVSIELKETSGLDLATAPTPEEKTVLLGAVRSTRCGSLPADQCSVTEANTTRRLSTLRRLSAYRLDFVVLIVIRDSADLNTTTPLTDASFATALQSAVVASLNTTANATSDLLGNTTLVIRAPTVTAVTVISVQLPEDSTVDVTTVQAEFTNTSAITQAINTAYGGNTTIVTAIVVDNCRGRTCGGNGQCANGVCTCYTGWIGNNCLLQTPAPTPAPTPSPTPAPVTNATTTTLAVGSSSDGEGMPWYGIVGIAAGAGVGLCLIIGGSIFLAFFAAKSKPPLLDNGPRAVAEVEASPDVMEDNYVTPV